MNDNMNPISFVLLALYFRHSGEDSDIKSDIRKKEKKKAKPVVFGQQEKEKIEAISLMIYTTAAFDVLCYSFESALHFYWINQQFVRWY